MEIPIEFRYRLGLNMQPDGMVAFYGIKNGLEYGMSYDNVDELIAGFEKVLASAKMFKKDELPALNTTGWIAYEPES